MAFKAQKNIAIRTTIENGTVTAQAETITLLPDTYIKAGTDFHAFIEPCQIEEADSKAPVFQTKTNTSSTGVKDLIKLEIYPNPLVNSTTLRFRLSEGGLTQISIYDINGRLQLKKDNPIGITGWNELFLDTSMLFGGTYTVQLKTATTILTNRMIVSK